MALVKLEHDYPDFEGKGLSDWDITHYDVIARGDEKVGSVDSILIDKNSKQFRYLVVDTGFWIFGKKFC